MSFGNRKRSGAVGFRIQPVADGAETADAIVTVRPRKTEDRGMPRQKAVVNSLSTLVLYQNSLKK